MSYHSIIFVVQLSLSIGSRCMSDTDTVASIFDKKTGILTYNDPAFIGPPMQFSTGGTKIASGGDPNKPYYDANTDIVNIMPFALERLVWMLLSTKFCPLADRIGDAHGITIRELEKTYQAFCKTLDYFTGPEARSTIDEAAKVSGYTDRPDMEKILVEGLLGRIMLSFYWFGIRGRTAMSGMPPVPPAYDRLPIIWNEIMQALDGVETPYAKKVKAKYGVVLQDNCMTIDDTDGEGIDDAKSSNNS